MHTVFALLCFVVVIHWLIFPYPSGLLHWHCGNLTIAPVPAKQPWWIWINTSCEFIMNDCITTTKQSTTKRCAYFLGYTVLWLMAFFCKLQVKSESGNSECYVNRDILDLLNVFVLCSNLQQSSKWCITDYRQTFNVRRTKSQNLNVSPLVLQLSLSTPF